MASEDRWTVCGGILGRLIWLNNKRSQQNSASAGQKKTPQTPDFPPQPRLYPPSSKPLTKNRRSKSNGYSQMVTVTIFFRPFFKLYHPSIKRLTARTESHVFAPSRLGFEGRRMRAADAGGKSPGGTDLSAAPISARPPFEKSVPQLDLFAITQPVSNSHIKTYD